MALAFLRLLTQKSGGKGVPDHSPLVGPAPSLLPGIGEMALWEKGSQAAQHSLGNALPSYRNEVEVVFSVPSFSVCRSCWASPVAYNQSKTKASVSSMRAGCLPKGPGVADFTAGPYTSCAKGCWSGAP